MARNNKKNLPWEVTEDGQQDVDPEVSGTSSLKEDTERWEEDGNAGTMLACFSLSLYISISGDSANLHDLADVGGGERHFD